MSDTLSITYDARFVLINFRIMYVLKAFILKLNSIQFMKSTVLLVVLSDASLAVNFNNVFVLF